MDDFIPAYKLNGSKDKTEAFLKIFQTLKEDEQTIISKGFSEEVLVSAGSTAVILKGKLPKKKDGKK